MTGEAAHGASSSLMSAGRPTTYLTGPHTAPLSSLGVYTLVREGFLLDQVVAMVSSSHLFDSAKVIKRILESSGPSGRRRKGGVYASRLDARQSAVAYQYAQALEDTLKVFGSQRIAEEWLGQPCIHLAGHVPLDLIENWWGFQAVREYLQRIEYGVYQ
ncbi:antitoxin Xre/MbcA/ParS toxin-binding domain-containing protein [Pseudomonas putida]